MPLHTPLTRRQVIRGIAAGGFQTGFILAGGLDAEAANGFDFHIDSRTGKDSNDGRSPRRAFKTLAALKGHLKPKTRIGLARGSEWREELRTDLPGISVAAYGKGTRPIIRGDDTLSAKGWTDNKDRTYSRTVTVPKHGLGFVNVWENGKFMALAKSRADCTKTPGSYFPSAQRGKITLTIHPAGSTDPARNGRSYDVPVRDYALHLGGAGSAMRGLHTKNQYHNNGSGLIGDDGTAEDCRFENGHKHNFFHSDGCLMRNCEFIEARYIRSGNLSVGFRGKGRSKGFTYENCTWTISEDQPDKGRITATTFHCNQGDMGVAVFRGGRINGNNIMESGLTGSGMASVMINGLTINEVKRGVEFGDSVPIVLEGARIRTTQPGFVGVSVIKKGQHVIIRKGTVFDMAQGPNSIALLTWQDCRLTIQDSTIRYAQKKPYGGSAPFRLQDRAVTIDFRRNTLDGNGFVIGEIIRKGAKAKIAQWNATAYNGDPAGNKFNLGGKTYSWEEWRALGHDKDARFDAAASAAGAPSTE